ncbi:MAG TPA: DUF4136 domain-containing protein [Bryobacteraceae bacterium]|jgi:hypothetical protein
MKTHLSRLLPLLAVGATLMFAKTWTDYDHHTDFNRYRTYSWGKVEANNSLWSDRIMAAVDSQLAAKGWTRVPSGGDAVVNAFGSTKAHPTLETFYNGFPGWYWNGWDGISTTTVDYNVKGNLTVDIFDGGTHRLIWRGALEKGLSDEPEKNEKKLDHEVGELFEHFPPKSKG